MSVDTLRPRDPLAYYRPKLAVPETLQPFLKQLEPGSDSFPEEREAAELGARLAELGIRLKPVSYTHLTLPTIYSV